MSQNKKLLFIINTESFEEFTPKLFLDDAEIIAELTRLIENEKFGPTLAQQFGEMKDDPIFAGESSTNDEILGTLRDLIEDEPYAVWINDIKLPASL